jgi:hypothetical protein
VYGVTDSAPDLGSRARRAKALPGSAWRWPSGPLALETAPAGRRERRSGARAPRLGVEGAA